jgi:predicted amidophosphoribosyltransferase
MVQIQPVRIPGRWRDGRALDVHTVSSTYIGEDEFGHAQFDTRRSAMGELLYRLKYRADRSVIDDVADTAASFVQGWWCEAELLVPVPPSRDRALQPVLAVGGQLAQRLGIEFCPGCVKRKREAPQLKDVFDYDERWKLLEGLHEVDQRKLEGRKVLLFDDLFRSGATMNAITGSLYDQGRTSDVYALTLTRTRSNQ